MFVLVRGISWLAVLLVSVLVTTQTLGLVHSITHGPSGSFLHAHDNGSAQDHPLAHAALDLPGNPGFLTALFPSPQEDSGCRLYDQASHGGAFVTLLQLAFPVVSPPRTVAIFQGEALARWAVLFDARGPPLTA